MAPEEKKAAHSSCSRQIKKKRVHSIGVSDFSPQTSSRSNDCREGTLAGACWRETRPMRTEDQLGRRSRRPVGLAGVQEPRVDDRTASRGSLRSIELCGRRPEIRLGRGFGPIDAVPTRWTVGDLEMRAFSAPPRGGARCISSASFLRGFLDGARIEIRRQLLVMVLAPRVNFTFAQSIPLTLQLRRSTPSC